jgi:branched-chain amino acid transport system ATP-binding protein
MSHVHPLLVLHEVEVVYEGIISALSSVSLRVEQGEVVALLGANGAGKSTTLRAISGLLSAERGEIRAGAVSFEGESTRRWTSRDLVRRGVVQVIEGRRCFAHLTVVENLLTGTFGTSGLSPLRSHGRFRQDLQRVFELFPRLATKQRARAGVLSGGEQQMLALGRALMTRPRLLLLDEPSMGLAPIVVAEIFEIVTRLNREEGVSVLIAEQNATLALEHATRAYVLENGRVALSGSAAELRSRDDVQHFYLGLNHHERRTSVAAGAGEHAASG